MAWSRDPHRYRGVPKALADQIRRRDNKTCRQCGQPGHQVDHIHNVRAGGTNDPQNLQTLCTPCHTAKTNSEAREGRTAWRNAHPRRRPTEAHPGLTQGE